MGENPSYFTWVENGPVDNVSWFNAIEYCNRRSISEGLIPCYSYGSYGTNPADWPAGWDNTSTNHTNVSCNWNAPGYRLPTNMEWLFAAKGGNLSHNYYYSGSNLVDLVAWYEEGSELISHPGAMKMGNEIGLFDMSGNLKEWVWDIFGEYPSGNLTDPVGPTAGSTRVLRNGCWGSSLSECAISYRESGYITNQDFTKGFRVCRRDTQAIAAPLFSIPGGAYSNSQAVVITCATPNVTIRFTLDGTEPNTSSPVYVGSITISSSSILKAKAFLEPMPPSLTTTAIYNLNASWVLVPAGSFNMGDTRGGGSSDQLPVHQVNVSPFHIGKYEITQSEWENLMGTSVMDSHSGDYGEGSQYPMYWVTWYQILVYSNTRSIAEGLTPVYTINGSTNPSSWGAVPSSSNATWDAVTCNWSANGYRLPTEAEWEYAARGAAYTPDYLYAGSDDIGIVSWYDGNNTPFGNKLVGTKAPNGLAIYDMSGSVWEWCWDRYGAYSADTQTNPTGPTTGTNHAMRGGSWYDGTDASRVSYRYNVHPWGGYFCIGFRLARTYTAPQVSTPTFGIEGGTYTTPQTVSISCTTQGATIRYTIDGSTPTGTSAIYSTPLNINAHTTLKAMAFLNGWSPSGIASASYYINSTFVMVDGGTFNNGSSNVTISPFIVEKTEVTQLGYQTIMGTNPAAGYGVDNNNPVYYITWFNTIEYCNRRSLNEGMTPCYSYGAYGTNPSNWPSGWNTSDSNHNNVTCNWTANGYRLLTEMEWQFAARGGILSNNCTYSGSNILDEVAWCGSNASGHTHTVGTKNSNELGIFDMSGNVWEWVWDIYAAYPTGDQTNPHGPSSGTNRIVRGGSWADYNTSSLEVAFRISIGTYTTYNNVGFRIARMFSGPYVATPTFNIPSGTYDQPQFVSISCSTSGAEIHYTTNGTNPTILSPVFSNPLHITETSLIKTRAFKSGWAASNVATASYIIATPYVQVAGGTFNNGASNVTISTFNIGKYEVTQAEYQAIMGSNPANSYGVGTNYPVYFVSWFNAIEYCNKRSIAEGLTPCYSYGTYGTNPANWPSGWNTSNANHTNVYCNWSSSNGYRLPTEMEWMFAARGGNYTHNYTYSGSDDVDAVAWHWGTACREVGSKAPNELGIYDMSGNIWEWCWDILANYPSGEQTNPHGPISGSNRTGRGGSWNMSPPYCVVSYRGTDVPVYTNRDVGFRVCINIPSFVTVAGGTFNNGTSNVTVSSFYLSKYELTQSDYQSVMGFNPSHFPGVNNGPVELVSWYNSIEYCNRRSILEGLNPCYTYSTYGTNPANWPAGWNANDNNHVNISCSWSANGYRLPTEAEWQFAALGGNQTHNYSYSGSNSVDAVAWYLSNSSSITHSTGLKTANELGLYDMSGNVWEWVWDIYGSYASGSQTNPYGAASGPYRVFRGGSWGNTAEYCAVSFRTSYTATTVGDGIGLRLCRKAP